MYRITLDTSAVSSANFDSVEVPLLNAVRSSEIEVWLTPLLMNEVVTMYQTPRHREHLRRLWPWLLQVSGQNWFDLMPSLIHSELIRDMGPRAEYRMRQVAVRNATREITEGIATDAWARFTELSGVREETFQTKSLRKEIFKSVRIEVAQIAKRRGVEVGSHTWEAHSGIQFEHWGAEIIKAFPGLEQPDPIISRWKNRKNCYPFYTALVEGFTYAEYHSAILHHEKIDGNASSDTELLASLVWADAVVSADTRFFKDAFDQLWAPRGKTFVHPTQLRERLAALPSCSNLRWRPS